MKVAQTVVAISVFVGASSVLAQPNPPKADPVYEAADGRILIKPRMKFELAVSLHVLKYAEDHHANFVTWAQRMRKSLPPDTLKEATALIDNSHEWQLGSLVADYDGPDTIEGITAFVRADRSGAIRKWASHWDGVMKALRITPKDFPGWYGGFLERYYQGGFGRGWETGQEDVVYDGAASLAHDLASIKESPTSYMERMTGRRFKGKAQVIFYPTTFSDPHAYGFEENGNKAVLYNVGLSSGAVLAIAYHELMHPLIRGWWNAKRMRAPLAKLAATPLFKQGWEAAGGNGNYDYPAGWADELIVHSLAKYLAVRAGTMDEASARTHSYGGYEDALFDALFDSYARFKTVDDFIYYALEHIHATGEGKEQRFIYERAP